MDNFITRQEHEEFTRRIDAENSRQNKRIDLLEKNVTQINALTVSVEKMALNMENMLEVLEKQGKRLEILEKEPAETSKQIKSAIITAVVGTVIGAVITAILMLV